MNGRPSMVELNPKPSLGVLLAVGDGYELCDDASIALPWTAALLLWLLQPATGQARCYNNDEPTIPVRPPFYASKSSVTQ
jgi:hypothetical protein